jgi:hypothetical protein
MAMRHIQRALAPAAAVLLILAPLFFRWAEGSDFFRIGGNMIDLWGLVLYGVFLVALVGGVYTVYRSI